MALLEMKSNLSQINKDFGDRSGRSIPDPTPTNTGQGVDYFANTHAFGFTTNRNNSALETDFRLNANGRPIIPQTLHLDIKGDFTPLYTFADKADNVYNLGVGVSPLENKSTIGLNGVTNFAETPNKMGFTFVPENSIENRYPTTRPATTEQSRIFFKHSKDRQNNAGFTRNALGLDNYYAQLFVDDGTFGIRNDSLKADNQPYVIRGIGQKWGNPDSSFPESIGTITRGKLEAAQALQFRGGLASRDPSVFKDRYKADVARLSKFGDPNSLYTNNQVILQGRNPFTSVTSIKYGLTTVDSGNPLIDALVSKTPYGDYLSLSPQVYNPDSVYSVPGVSGMMFNRMAMTGTDVFNISDQIDDAVGIIANISTKALELAAPEAEKVISRKLTNLGQELGEKASGFFANAKIGTGQGKSKKLSEIANTKFGKTDRSIVERANSVGDKLKKANQFRKEAGLLFANEKAAAAKATFVNLDKAAFEDVAVDRVNLIPYGKEEYGGTSYDKLDWIPFKFFDVVGNKPIVFRAILSGITDTFNPEYASERYVGRPDNVYVYQGTTREISFTFDVYPKSDRELIVLWTKLNHLAGLTYPHYTSPDATGGQAMISPYTKLTIGDMYNNAPGYISSLTYTVQDNGNWEVDFAKLPKYIQVSCTFVYIGDRLLEAGENAKHYDLPFIADTVYQNQGAVFVDKVATALVDAAFKSDKSFGDTMQQQFPNILGAAGK